MVHEMKCSGEKVEVREERRYRACALPQERRQEAVQREGGKEEAELACPNVERENEAPVACRETALQRGGSRNPASRV